MAHALAGSFLSFVIVRSALGLGESGLFPASIKTVAEWFPKKERSFATGIFNAGSNLGAMITPLLVPWITVRWGWRLAFVVTGAIGFLWLALWLAFYRKPEEHGRLSAQEFRYIRSDPAPTVAKVRWLSLLPHRQTWAFVTGKFLIDPIWWFYLFWVPDFLQRRHGLSLVGIGLPVVTIYLLSDIGSVGGGWISSRLIAKGTNTGRARKTAMLICSLCVLPIVFASRANNMWVAVVLIGLAAAGHQGFSANLLTLTSDMFPAAAVASVVGIGGMAGAVGGMLIAKIVGYILQSTGSYLIPFFIAGSAYVAALICIHLLAPRMEVVQIAS